VSGESLTAGQLTEKMDPDMIIDIRVLWLQLTFVTHKLAGHLFSNLVKMVF
jgi:hypothetical protein